MKHLLLACLATVLVFSASPAPAADFPAKPITIIVPFAAGGDTDIVARLFAESLSKELKQNVLVQNIVGASGSNGLTTLLSSKPDGYTLGMSPSAPLVFHPHMRKTPYNLDSFSFIGRISNSPLVVVVQKSSPWKTLDDMIADMKANPDKYFWGSSGVGSVPYFALMDLFSSYGVSVKHVPFSGDAAAFQDLAGNRIQVYATTAGVLDKFDIKALAVTDKARIPTLPDLPCMKDFGKEVYISLWVSFFGPKDLPANVVSTLSKAMEKACASPELVDGMKKLNMSVGYLNSEDCKKFAQEEFARNKDVVVRLMPKE